MTLPKNGDVQSYTHYTSHTIQPNATNSILRTIVASFAFFFIMMSYYIIQPTRTSILFAHVEGERFFKLFYALNAIVSFGGVLLYNHLVSRFSRTYVIRYLFIGTIIVFILFWGLFYYALPHQKAMIQEFDGSESAFSRLFYAECFVSCTASFYHIFVCIYILFFTAIFWSFNHELNTSKQSKIAYPYIFFGGQAGVILGSKITQLASPKIGSYNLVWLCIIGLIGCCLGLECLRQFDPYPPDKKLQPTKVSKDFSIFLNNKYILFIALIVILGTFALTLCDYQYKLLMKEQIPSRDAQTVFLARNNSIMGIGNIIMSALITPLLLRYIGPAFSIMAFPLILLLTGIMFLFKMDIYTAAIFAISVSCCYYTLYQVGKEIFYVPTDEDTKYKAKAVCDIFGYRFGDMLGSGIIIFYSLIFGALSGLNYILFFVIIFWLWMLNSMDGKYRFCVKKSIKMNTQTTEKTP